MSAPKKVTAYRVTAGSLQRMYYTPYHAEQMARALRLNGMKPVIDTLTLVNDPLTRLTVSGAPHWRLP